eukprot:scaffold257513_cov42-Prasinocladus_malaysianus.AAC.1
MPTHNLQELQGCVVRRLWLLCGDPAGQAGAGAHQPAGDREGGPDHRRRERGGRDRREVPRDTAKREDQPFAKGSPRAAGSLTKWHHNVSR